MQLKRYASFCLFLCFFHTLSGQVIDSARLAVSNRVLFDFGEYTLTDAADSTIVEVLEKISHLKNYAIQITAHTDAIGSNEANFLLSKNRATTVKQRLVAAGIADSLITTKVYGEDRPKANNKTDSGRQLNRRATIKAFEGIKLVKFEGRIKDKDTNEGITAKVVIRTKTTKDSLATDSLGKFATLLPLGTVVGMDVFAKNYFFETKMFKVKPSVGDQLTISLKKIKTGEKVDIKNLFFVGNEATLLKRSLPELPKLLKFMELNDSIKIEIAGHINRPNHPPVDKLSWDYKLSVKRAKMVYDYLLAHNVSEGRISYKGYGNFQMRFPKAKTEQEQAQNRRVEIRIVAGT
ncbi:MAG: OmpA family protein [Bacteroidota bacterium]